MRKKKDESKEESPTKAFMEEGYKIIQSVEELAGSLTESTGATPVSTKVDNSSSSLPKKKTPEELQRDINGTRRPISRTTLLCRRVKLNSDLAILALVMSLSAFLGFSINDFRWSNLSSYLQVIAGIVGSIVAALWHVHTPKGMYSQNVTERASKGEGEVDEWGRSISIKR